MDPPAKKLRRTKWSSEDERYLLEIWEAYEIELRQCKRNSHIYARMSEEMGGKYTSHEIHVKINNMAQKYRSEKKGIGSSGGCPSKWQHYNYVHKIIGKNATNNRPTIESFVYNHSDSNVCLNDMSQMNSATEFEWLSTSISPVASPGLFPPSMSSPSNTAPLISPTPSTSSTVLSSPTPSPEPPPSSSGRKRMNAEVIQSIFRQTELGEENLQILNNISEDNRTLCQHFAKFLDQQEENEKVFLEYFKKLVEKD